MTSMPQLCSKLGVGSCCGKCNAYAKQVLRECLDEAGNTETLQLQTAVAA